MTERIVFNTSPLIALGKMQAFEAISRLSFEFVCPAEVAAEISTGNAQGYDVEIPSFITVFRSKTRFHCLPSLRWMQVKPPSFNWRWKIIFHRFALMNSKADAPH